MLTSALLLAATALPLGVWPLDTGPAVIEVGDIEFYVLEPEDDYWILAVAPLDPPLERAEPGALRQLTTLAKRLGADGVLLLGALAVADIPDDPDEPLPAGKRFSEAVFVTFDVSGDYGDEGSVPGVARSSRRDAVTPARGRNDGSSPYRRLRARGR